jgi:hypothetical protein
MSDGQLAINTNATSTGLFFKDSAGALVKVGPVHIGTTAPNATPASGGQSGNTVGEQWLDTTGGNYVLKIWDGSAWRSEAGEFVNASGDTMTGALVMDNQQQVRFRETTANGTNFIALQAPALVASDKTITLPDVTGTVVTTGDTGTVTSTMLLDGTIVNADVNASAAIAGTKIAPDFGSQNVTTTGTATAAALIPSGSSVPTNGVYLPSSNNVAISTNGTGRLFVNSAGNVGIGAAPGHALDVNGQVQAKGQIYLTDSSGNDVIRFTEIGSRDARMDAFNGTDFNGALRYAGANLIFETGTGASVSERMRLDSSGRLGLGTSSASARLHVSGSSSALLSAQTSNYAPSAGSDTTSLIIANDQSTTGEYTSLEFWQRNAASNINIAYIASPSSSTDNTGTLVFGRRTGVNTSAESMRIDSSGRVGVGTTAPGAILNLYGSNVAGVGQLKIDSPSGEYSQLTLHQGATSFAFFRSNSSAFDVGSAANIPFTLHTNGSERARITADGKLGLGTSSADNKLSVGIASADEGIELKATYNGARVARFALLNPGVDNTPYIGSVSGNDFGFITSGTRRMTLTAGGSLGIGTTSPGFALEVASNVNYQGYFVNNASGTGVVIGGISGAGTITSQGTATPLVFAHGGTEAARIDASSRLLVGTSSTSAAARIMIAGGDGSRGTLNIASTSASPADGDDLGLISFNDSTHIYNNALIRAQRDGGTWTATTSKPTRLVFSVTRDAEASPTERMRINNAGATANYAAESVYHASSAAGAGTTHRLYTGNYSATATFGGTTSFLVWTNGNVENTNNSYGAISDIKLKENIVNANSQWNDLKALQVRNYNFKEGQTHTQIGLIAQEAELISPGLVSETPDRDAEGNDLGTVTKSVNYSVLYMKAVKALQEAMERIEQLENSNADLLARVTALEAQ